MTTGALPKTCHVPRRRIHDSRNDDLPMTATAGVTLTLAVRVSNSHTMNISTKPKHFKNREKKPKEATEN